MTAKAIGSFFSGTAAARFPVWSGSTTKQVNFRPMKKGEAWAWYQAAYRHEIRTRTPGHQDGAIGRNGLRVLEGLVREFLNFATGALFPSYAAIATATGLSVSSVYRGLCKLRDCGVLGWVNRCHRETDGTFVQDSNAYHLHKPESWKGYAADAIVKRAARTARAVLRLGALAASSAGASLPLPDVPLKPGPLSDALARLNSTRRKNAGGESS
jgi:hypothetical protein